MTISSPVFNNLGEIPSVYACEGDGINPPLEISDVPTACKSLVLIIDDPDAPNGVFDHWIIWNIDPQTYEIFEDSTPKEANFGLNSGGTTDYVPPCPPEGEHHYRFLLFALKEKLNLPSGADRDQLEEAMNELIIDKALLIGTYTSEKNSVI